MAVDRDRLHTYPGYYSKSIMGATAERMNKECGPKAMIISIEELSELIKAISKNLRFTNNRGIDHNYRQHREDIIEELADVMISIESIKHKYRIDNGTLEQMIAYKLDRVNWKLDNGTFIEI